MKDLVHRLLKRDIKNFLFLDLGTTTGLVNVDFKTFVSPDNYYHLKEETFFEINYIGDFNCSYKLIGYEPWARNAKIFEKFNNVLEQFILPNGQTAVFYEDVKRWASSAAAKRYGGLVCCLERKMFAAQGVAEALNPVPPKTIKKEFAGSGSASKAQMISTAKLIYPELLDFHYPVTDNMADALGLMHFILNDAGILNWRI